MRSSSPTSMAAQRRSRSEPGRDDRAPHTRPLAVAPIACTMTHHDFRLSMW